MKCNTTKAGLAIVLSATLAACGGGGGGSDTPAPTNAAPSISGMPATSLNVGETYSFTPTASDPDGDTLTFSIENQPLWATFDEATGTLSGNPAASNIGSADNINITVSDGRLTDTLSAFSIAVMPEQLGRANFSPLGDVTPIDNGYQSDGDLMIMTDSQEQIFRNASLTLTFDENDVLEDLSGETDVPIRISDNVAIEGNVRSVVQTMTGREINADDTFGIQLIDDTNYFVFYIGTSFDIVITDRNNPADIETVTLSTPAAGEILLIIDPTDTFRYDFASTPLLGARGVGESDNGLIPFVPALPFTELDSFTGHELEKATVSVGTRYVDFFEVTGTAVIRNPQFGDINWEDVFDSDIEFRAGLNGDLDFALSVVGFGLFSFDLADSSTTLDIGFDRQQIAMSFEIDPDFSLFPDPYNIAPRTTTTGDGYINGDGTYGIFLETDWGISLPEASIAGQMSFVDDVVTLAGQVTEGDDTLTVALTFENNETTASIEFPEPFESNINNTVTESLDRQLADVAQTQQDLEDATADYELEVSLRGLRESLPTMMDQAVVTLNAIPGDARRDAESSTRSYMASECVNLVFSRVCLDDIAPANTIAQAAGNVAHTSASNAIVGPLASMMELKRRALEDDDESLRAALEVALNDAYDNRTVRFSASYAVNFGSPFNRRITVFSRTWNETVLSASNASSIRTAADNVFRIQETSDIRIDTQRIFDALPTEEILNRVKQDVEDGVAVIPSVDGLGYVVSTGSYEPFVIISGEDRSVGFNVLEPSSVVEGVSDLLRDILVDDEEQN